MEVDDTDAAEESYQDILSNRVTALAVQLPTGVVDIDSEDLDNPQLCSEYAPVNYCESFKNLIIIFCLIFLPSNLTFRFNWFSF